MNFSFLILAQKLIKFEQKDRYQWPSGPEPPANRKKRPRTQCVHDLLIQILSKIDFVSILPQLFSKQSWLLAGLTSPKPCLINSFAKPGLPSVLISHSRMFKFLAFILQSRLAHLCKGTAFPQSFCHFLIPSSHCFDRNRYTHRMFQFILGSFPATFHIQKTVDSSKFPTKFKLF